MKCCRRLCRNKLHWSSPCWACTNYFQGTLNARIKDDEASWWVYNLTITYPFQLNLVNVQRNEKRHRFTLRAAFVGVCRADDFATRLCVWSLHSLRPRPMRHPSLLRSGSTTRFRVSRPPIISAPQPARDLSTRQRNVNFVCSFFLSFSSSGVLDLMSDRWIRTWNKLFNPLTWQYHVFVEWATRWRRGRPMQIRFD